MSREKQSVKKTFGTLGGRGGGDIKEQEKEDRGMGQYLSGLLASIGAPILGEIAKPILGKILSRGHRRRRIRSGKKLFQDADLLQK